MDCTIEYVQKRTEDYRFSCEEMYHGRILDLILLIRSVFFLSCFRTSCSLYIAPSKTFETSSTLYDSNLGAKFFELPKGEKTNKQEIFATLLLNLMECYEYIGRRTEGTAAQI